MKTVYQILFGIFVVLMSCADDDQPSGSRAYVLSDRNFRANISIYDYPGKKLTQDFYIADSEFANGVISANRNGESIYMNTVHPSILRKIDLSSGAELKSIESWSSYDQKIAFHGKDVIFCHLALDDPNYASVIKIYDENLVLKDSIAFPAAYGLKAVQVMSDKLFMSMFDGNGAYLQVYDLAGKKFLEPMELPGTCWQLIALDNNKMLVVMNDRYYTLDAQTLQESGLVTSYLGASPAVYDAVSKKLLWLGPLAQPALHPYILCEIDLVTGKSTALNDGRESIIGPFVYDAQSKLIMSGPGIKTFSRDGKLLDKIETTSETKFILLR